MGWLDKLVQHICFFKDKECCWIYRGIGNSLGSTRDDVGLHSIRSEGAMTVFLSGVSEIIIQQTGWWESFAFLEYIREQVENFTYGVSKKMLDNEKNHHLNEKNLPRQARMQSNIENLRTKMEREEHPKGCFVPIIHWGDQVAMRIKMNLNFDHE